MTRQLKTPNLDPIIYQNGKVLMSWFGYCLAYVQTAFNAPWAGGTAWESWLTMTKHKHENRNIPAGVFVPIWFSHVGTYGGVRKNWGHVAIYKDGKIWSSPITNKPYADVFNSIAAVEKAFGAIYVGWSEDVAGMKVIELVNVTKGDIMNQESGAELYRTALHREPENAGAAAQWNGQTAANALKVVRTAPEWKGLQTKVRAYETLAKQVTDMQNLINSLNSRPTKEDYARVQAQLSEQVAAVAAKQAALEAEQKKVKIEYTHDEETKNMIASIYNYFVGQYKTFAKYIKKG